MDELNAEQRYQFCVALSLDEIFEPLSEPDEIRIVSYVNEVPKFGIAYAGSIVIAELLFHSQLGNQNKELINLGRVERSTPSLILSLIDEPAFADWVRTHIEPGK
jgi:hypothetical protein